MFESASEVPAPTLSFLISLDGEEEAPPATTGEKGIFGRPERERGAGVSLREIPVAVLRESVRRTIGGLRQVFDEIAAADGDLPLKEAQISFEVTASGGIALVGTSAQVAGRGAITLTFGS